MTSSAGLGEGDHPAQHFLELQSGSDISEQRALAARHQLGAPPGADIQRGADHSHGIARRVAPDGAADLDVSPATIGAAKAMLVGPQVLAPRHDGVDRADHALPLVGMQPLVPPGGGGTERAGPVAEVPVGPMFPHDAVGQEVPVPDGIVGALGDET